MYSDPSLAWRLLATLAEFAATTLLFYVVAFSFGAYLLESVLETVLFGATMSVLSVMPILVSVDHVHPHGVLERVLIKNEFESKWERALTYLSYGSIVGAWLGALVIPLDWDRWWQQWPLSCLFGAALGSIGGVVFHVVRERFFNIKQHNWDL